MRYPLILFTALVLAACSTPPADKSSETRAANPAQEVVPEPQEASVDSVAQVLLAYAAADLHAHRSPDPVRFRDVRLGYLMNPDGESRYILCGQFLPFQGGDTEAEWMPFVTIKTDPYEQYLGMQAEGLCQNPSIVWQVGDLSSAMQSRLESLR